MFEVIFLGTSAATPSARRGLSAHMVLFNQYRFLIDCGEGTQRQILRSGLGFKGLNKILITHSHLDHILGLGGLISTLGRWETLGDITIYGAQSALDRISDLIYRVVWRGHRTPVKINLVLLHPGMVLLEDNKFRLTTFPVSHRGSDSFGFVFEEKARRPFLAEKADALGVPQGPERGQLVRGQTLTLANGQLVTPDDVLGDLIPGTKYVHVGDTGRTGNLFDVCQDADALTIEATYTEEEAKLAKEFGHMTAAMSARLAQKSGVKTLLLTHISRRYPGRAIKQEARLTHPATYVARDFDHFQISRDGTKRLPNRENLRN